MTVTVTEHQIRNVMQDHAAKDARWAIAYALMRLADAQESVATQLKYLGNGDAATQMGAMEALGLQLGEKLQAVADALEMMGSEVSGALDSVAVSIAEVAPSKHIAGS